MASDSINEFQIESVFPHSNEETTVTGHVAKGSIRSGETVSLTSATGVPLLAPIVRIGNADTPINVVRTGQKTTLVLLIEPQHVVPGSRLTTRNDESAFGATVIVTNSEQASVSRSEIEKESGLAEAEQLVNQRKFEEGRLRLESFLAALPESCAAHRLLARVYLESEPPLFDVEKALEHVKLSFEYGGHDDPEVQETLALALGAHGQAEHGLRYIERLFEQALTPGDRTKYQDKITSFRNRFSVPDFWEFMDEYGAVIYQSSNVDDIAKAIQNGSIPKSSDCRRNKVGQPETIADSIGCQHPEIGTLLNSSGPGVNKALDIAIGAGAGLLLGVVLDMFLAIPPMLAVTAGALTGASAVLLLTQRRAKTV